MKKSQKIFLFLSLVLAVLFFGQGNAGASCSTSDTPAPPSLASFSVSLNGPQTLLTANLVYDRGGTCTGGGGAGVTNYASLSFALDGNPIAPNANSVSLQCEPAGGNCAFSGNFDVSFIQTNSPPTHELKAILSGRGGIISSRQFFNITNRGPLNLKPVSGLPSCAAGSYAGQGTLSWNGQPDTNGGYWVDISPDNFAAVFYNKYVSGGLTNQDIQI